MLGIVSCKKGLVLQLFWRKDAYLGKRRAAETSARIGEGNIYLLLLLRSKSNK